MRDAAELISHEAVFVSHTSLARLEDFGEPPSDRKRRAWACFAAMAYGYEPKDFGLSVDDLPQSVDVEAFIARAQALKPKGENGGGGGSPAPGSPRINGRFTADTQATAA